LLILNVVFADGVEQVEVRLDHPVSNIRRLVVRVDAPNEKASGYQTHPLRHNYSPREVSRHPWTPLTDSPHELPAFLLSNESERVGVSDADWKARDTVFGFGNDRSNVRFAELLLNASQPSSSVHEFALEGEAGFRGVAPLSAEVRLWLPGRLGFSAELLAAEEPADRT